MRVSPSTVGALPPDLTRQLKSGLTPWSRRRRGERERGEHSGQEHEPGGAGARGVKVLPPHFVPSCPDGFAGGHTPPAV
jgi:hypothetical protein